MQQCRTRCREHAKISPHFHGLLFEDAGLVSPLLHCCILAGPFIGLSCKVAAFGDYHVSVEHAMSQKWGPGPSYLSSQTSSIRQLLDPHILGEPHPMAAGLTGEIEGARSQAEAALSAYVGDRRELSDGDGGDGNSAVPKSRPNIPNTAMPAELRKAGRGSLAGGN